MKPLPINIDRGVLIARFRARREKLERQMEKYSTGYDIDKDLRRLFRDRISELEAIASEIFGISMEELR